MNMIHDLLKDGIKESFNNIKKHEISYKDISMASAFFTFIFYLLVYPFVLNVLYGDKTKNNNDITINGLHKEFSYIKSNTDGIFYEMKNTAKTPYPWITARVDINRSNNVWENDVAAIMKKRGWKQNINKKALSKTILCKDGSELVLEHVVYKDKTYQFVSLLHDDFTNEDCQ